MKLNAVDIKKEVTFEDMEFAHKNKELVTGDAFSGESAAFRRKLEHPNEADVTMQRIMDRNGKKE